MTAFEIKMEDKIFPAFFRKIYKAESKYSSTIKFVEIKSNVKYISRAPASWTFTLLHIVQTACILIQN